MKEPPPGSQCVVGAADFREHWEGQTAPTRAEKEPRYTGPDRRANAHDRRFYAGVGGRRLLDRKS
jgi:hypothetical protein